MPYAHSTPALAFAKNVVGYKPSPTLNDLFALVRVSDADSGARAEEPTARPRALADAALHRSPRPADRPCPDRAVDPLFIWVRALPGTPAESLLGERADEQSIAQIRDQLGLDDPIYVQYWRYVSTMSSGDLGTSIASRRLITDELRERFPATVELAFAAGFFAVLVGVPLGFYRGEAVRRRRSTTRASFFR